MNGLSWLEGSHWLEGLITCLETKVLLQLGSKELGILGEISVSLEAGVAGEFCNLDAVVDPITASNAVEKTPENTIFSTLDTSLHSLAEISHFALDEERSAPRPTTGITKKIGQLEGLASVPYINALGYTACLVGAADALTDFLEHGWLGHRLAFCLYIDCKLN